MVRNIIETFDLTKKYKLKGRKSEITALNNVSISIGKGEVFGLLGPNGAGKTTMIQILTTITQPTSGYAVIDGFNVIKDPRAVKNKIALMLDRKLLYNRLTAYSNLKFFCKLYEVPNYKEKIFSIAEEFKLKKWLNQYTGDFSSGMRMKLALCRTLLLNRDILFLDEPTVGIDLQTRVFIIQKLQNLGKTIFLSSHDMGVVEALCDRIAFINKGIIVKIGMKEDIKKLGQTEINIELEVKEFSNQLKLELKKQNFVKRIIDNKIFFIVTIKERKYYNDLLSILNKYKVMRIKEREPSLENLFMKLI